MGDSTLPRADYGIDAPGVVRNLFLAGSAGLVLALCGAALVWSGWPWGQSLVWMGGCPAACFLAMGCYMVWGSKVGKLRDRERLLDLVPWKGDETVLDVGCGRGLMLLGAARRLSTGKAHGVDIWQTSDQSGNRPEATTENARREGVADRVEIHTADMRRLPFPDASFDVIVSHWAVHNLPTPADRAQAVGEMARVLKPGGRLVLADIAYLGEYAARLQDCGLTDVARVGSRWKLFLLAAVSFGGVRPDIVVARKPA